MEIPPEVLAAKELAEPALMAVPGVIGVGIGMREENGELFDELAVRIYLDEDLRDPPVLLEEIAGVPICLIRDRIEPLVSPDIDRYDELAGGIKVSRPMIGFGTMGVLVEDARNPGSLLGLSNFHVVGDVGGTYPDTIWQPNESPLVTGSPPAPANNIGSVVRVSFPQLQPIPFVTVPVGLVDAAVFAVDVALGLAPPGSGLAVLPPADQRTTSPKIVGQGGLGTTLIDRVIATAVPSAGQPVMKRGFATRVTTGFVIDPSARFNWPTNNSNQHLIEQMLIVGSSTNPNGIFCEPGDSGSLVIVDSTSTAIGLLWGRMGAGTRGLASAIRNVESQLDVRTAWAP